MIRLYRLALKFSVCAAAGGGGDAGLVVGFLKAVLQGLGCSLQDLAARFLVYHFKIS